MAQNLKINILAQDKTKQALNSVKGGLARVKSAVFSLQTAFVGLGAGLVIKNLVGTGRELENLRVRLKFLLKDTNEGAKAFDNMVKFASKVPFSLEEIQSGSGILATVTDNATDLQKMLEITGNVAATTGLDFRTAAEQIQRSFSAGIGAADLFREKGVRNMLGFKAGATVSIEDTVKAFERVFGRGGRFGNSTDELAKTFEGTLSMIGDKIFNFKKVLLEAGFFEELKRQFGDLDKFLADNAEKLDEIATTVGKNLANAVAGAVKVGKDLVPVIREIGAVLGSIIKGFNELPAFVKSIGLVGAMLFGKKGAAALAGISFIIGKIKELSELPKIIPISDMDLKTVQDINDEITKLKEKIIQPSSFVNDVGLEEFGELTDAQIAHNKVVRNQLEILEEILVLEKQRLPHHFELHKGLKETTKELEKQKTQRKFIKNAFEADLDLVKRLEKAEKQRTDRLLGSSRNIFDEQQKLIFKTKEELSTRDKIVKKIKDQNEEFDLTDKIFEQIDNTTKSFSRSLAESLVLGKDIVKSFKELSQRILIDILAKSIERIAFLGLEKALTKTIEILEERKKNKIIQQNAALKQQLAIQSAIAAVSNISSIGGFFSGLFRASGGSVQKGQPTIVGEQGAEMFIPNSSGQITQAARGVGGGAVNVNFNINTVDASGFEELLVRSRGTITQLINNAVNEKGRSSII